MKKIVDLKKWNEFYRKMMWHHGASAIDFECRAAIDEVDNWLIEQPDAEEKRGKWELHKDGSATCTRCKTTQMHVWDMEGFQNYCGHCGASMELRR